MSEAARCERTVRLLRARIEELARALERTSTAPDAARLLEAASVATAHAVDLELLTSERAAELWREAAERHPHVEPLRLSRRAA